MNYSYPILLQNKDQQLLGEIYIQSPTDFIINNYPKLLPTWSNYPQSVMIVLLLSNSLISENNSIVEAEKQRLKLAFLNWGNQLKLKLIQSSLKLEIIDPQTGYPIYSTAGEISFDIVRVIHQSLSFQIKEQKGCKILEYPTQLIGLYPCLLLSDAKETEVYDLLL